jgi:hypothetical protein
MVAGADDRWQAGAVRVRNAWSALLTLALIAGPAALGGTIARSGPLLVQAPAPADAPRTMLFSWTLYPSMWAEVDLRLGPGAEAVAEISVEGGAVSWNLHLHPVETEPATVVSLAQGVSARETVRCAPDAFGRYSYLFASDGSPGPVRLRVELTLRGDARLEAIRP